MGYALGIDLGTTFTAAAVMRAGRAEVVALGNHAATIPTMVFLRDDDGILIGDAAERRGLNEPNRLAREFKRRLGDTAPIMLDRTPFSADRLLGLMLRQIVADVTERQGGAPDAVTVTHPANWGAYKVDLLRQAVQLAGIPTAAFLSEPVAAAVQYAAGERVEPGEVVAVYDLGGGTFDAAVLRKTATGFETVGRPQGIERLGGIDFDEAVLTHVRKVVGDSIATLDPTDPPIRAAFARLRHECVLAKESLSADSDATVPVLLPNLQTQVRITRTEFEDMIRPILRETIDSLKRAIESSGVPLAQVKAVLLAGGSSRIPLVADMVRSELGRPVVTDTHPKHAVALGAARHAAGATSPAAPVAVPPVPAPPAASAPARPVPSSGAPTVPAAVVAGAGAAGSAAAAARAGGSGSGSGAGAKATKAAGSGAGAPTKKIVKTSTTTTAAAKGPPAGGPPPQKRSQWLLFGIGLAAAALAVGALVVLTSGDDDSTTGDTISQSTVGGTDSGTTLAGTETSAGGSTATTSGDTATTVNVNQSCSEATGNCVGISSAVWEGDTLVVQYTVDGFEPNDNGISGEFHVHFFMSTVDPENAGVPQSGPWIVWDRADGGGELVFDGFDQSNIIEYGYEDGSSVCITQANHDHTLVEAQNYYCYPIPTPGQ